MDKVIEYDLDTSGGLMEKIQALIAPPQSSEESRRRCKKNSETYFRRGGKTINHDSCDACGEGGDLLCCDRCPASFHFACCDPPLEEDDIPDGEWLCNECRHGITQEEQQKKEKSETSADDASSDSCIDFALPPKAKEQSKPFSQLTEMYKNKNPSEFSLPPELQDFTILPGDRKTRQSNDQGAKNGKREDDELEKLCFSCTRHESLSPLAHCDFCPLSFHLDCLNPPLSQLPTGMWMCPNHPDHYEPGTQNPRFSLKVECINELRSSLNHTAIKLSFIQKAKRSRILMNRFRRRIRRTIVPQSIKAQYRCPPYQFLPESIKEMQRPLPPHVLPIRLPSKQEQEEWLKAIVNMQCEIAKEISRPALHKSTPAESTKAASDNSSSPGLGAKEAPSSTDCGTTSPSVSLPSPKSAGVGLKTSPGSSPVPPASSLQRSGSLVRHGSISTGSSTAAKVIILATQAPFGAMKSSDVVSSQSAMSSLSTIASFASNQGKSAINVGKSSLSVPNLSGSHVISSVNSETLQDPTLSLLDDRLVRVLAFQRLQQLTGQNKNQSSSANASNTSMSKSPEENTGNYRTTSHEGDAIASLCPVFGSSKPILMTKKCLNIGVSLDNTVCLASFGNCNFTSPKHACIFYDEDAKQFELLNYSEHGTIVDNVLYSCDFSEKLNKSVKSSGAKHDEKRKFYNQREQVKQPPSNRTTSGHGVRPLTWACSCRGSGSSFVYGGSGAGWEGTAVLHHGSYIKCGCLHFIFSTAECSTMAPQALPKKQISDPIKTDIDVCG